MNRKNQPIHKFGRMMIAALLLFPVAPWVAGAAGNGEVMVEKVSMIKDGEPAILDDPAIMLDGRLYMPAASLAGLFGSSAEWDSSHEAVTIQTGDGDSIVMSDGVPVVYFNDQRYLMDAAPFIHDERIYIPLRYMAALMSADATWDIDRNEAQLTALESTEDVLSEVFSEAEPFTEEDYLLLAKLVQVESGYESYEGQLAVANIILNRVKDSRFPSTIHDVIYSGRQFPPAHNGLLDKSKPNASVLRAAKDALNGKNNIDDAVYFFNPEVSRGSFWNNLEVVARIGNHHFAK